MNNIQMLGLVIIWCLTMVWSYVIGKSKERKKRNFDIQEYQRWISSMSEQLTKQREENDKLKRRLEEINEEIEKPNCWSTPIDLQPSYFWKEVYDWEGKWK